MDTEEMSDKIVDHSARLDKLERDWLPRQRRIEAKMVQQAILTLGLMAIAFIIGVSL